MQLEAEKSGALNFYYYYYYYEMWLQWSVQTSKKKINLVLKLLFGQSGTQLHLQIMSARFRVHTSTNQLACTQVHVCVLHTCRARTKSCRISWISPRYIITTNLTGPLVSLGFDNLNSKVEAVRTARSVCRGSTIPGATTNDGATHKTHNTNTSATETVAVPWQPNQRSTAASDIEFGQKWIQLK